MKVSKGVFIFSLFFLFLPSNLWGQGLTLTPLKSRNVSEFNFSQNQIAALRKDSLVLPFFEDFVSTTGFPSELRWVENQVWINNSFPLNQPNFNVATFDHLNHKGKPYSTLDKTKMVYADSLTSQPINLAFYKSGINTIPYKLSDSILLSFFYETQGLGDAPETEDSLILFFKNRFGNWQKVWATKGHVQDTFSQIVVTVNNTDWLFDHFQFRFVNYTKSTGNLNHWHIDYIQFDKNRSRTSLNINDVGIVKSKSPMLNNYNTIPYSHFKTNVLGLSATSHSVVVKNLNKKDIVQTRFAYDVFNQYNTLVKSVPFSFSSRNVLPNNRDTTEEFPSFVLDTFSGTNPSYRIKYKILPQSFDNTPVSYNAAGDNNTFEVKRSFTPWYAYDDGSAEGGFGLDYAFLGNIKGQFAMKFDNQKGDSLRGLAIYFNRSESDVSFRSFTLRIWKGLTPAGTPDNKDTLIYSFPIDHPVYTDSINNFTYIFFDTVLFIPKGIYYVGWLQNQPYVLNVGYDNNYRYKNQDIGNQNLFYNLLGQWEHAAYEVKGVPMIRPLFGGTGDYRFKTKETMKPKITLYPNPASNFVAWQSPLPVLSADLITMQGKLIYSQRNPNSTIDISMCKPGMIILVLHLQDGSTISKQIIKL